MKRFRITKRAALRLITIVLSLAYGAYVYSHSEGMTGVTRKGASPGCTCHGLSPTSAVVVTIAGPETLTVSESGMYTVAISGGSAVRGGTDIAASHGVLAPLDTTLQLVGDELTHVSPKPFSAGSVAFNFQYTASTTAARETLFANGNSVNFNGLSTGDTWNFAPNKPLVVQSIALTSPNGGESWTAGSSQVIAWTSAFVAAVRIEVSTDNGGFWSTVSASWPAAGGTYAWTVPGTPTAQAVVRVSDASRPTTADASDGAFTIQALPPSLHVTSPNGGESWVAGSPHAITWSPTSVASLRAEYSGDGGTGWTLIGDGIDASAGMFAWSVPTATTVSALIRLSDMSDFGVNDTSDALFAVLTGATVPVNVGWNMVSLPLSVSDARKSTLFPTATSGAFAYHGGYQLKDTLENGTGYWVKFSADQIVDIVGATRAADTVAVSAGWNMIGSVSAPLPVVSIAADPTGILQSPFYGYGGSYGVADTIFPGNGYWVKAAQAGTLVLSSSALMPGASAFVATLLSELPPPPPERLAAGSRGMPSTPALEQNYPNPFNPSTLIRYRLSAGAHVRLRVYSALGEAVATLVDEAQEPGEKSVTWDAAALPSGVYVCELIAGGSREMRKMLVIR